MANFNKYIKYVKKIYIFPLLSFFTKAFFKCSIVVTPRVLDSTEEVRSLSKTERHCKFSDEADDSALFSIYSYSGCLFECLWRQAKEGCGCIPWKYPQLENESMICDYVGNECFKKILDEGSRILNCTCLVDCSKISYDFYIVKEQLNPDLECFDKNKNSFLIEYLKKYQVCIS